MKSRHAKRHSRRFSKMLKLVWISLAILFSALLQSQNDCCAQKEDIRKKFLPPDIIRDLIDADERALLARLPGIIRSISYSPDGSMLAAAGGNLVRIWNTATWKELTTLKDFRFGVTCLAYSPDGKTLATTGFKEPARLYDTGTWGIRHKLHGEDESTRCVAFIATAGFSDLVGLWDVATGNQFKSFPMGIEGLFALAFTDGGKALAGGGNHGKAVLWNIAEQKPRAMLKGHQAVIYSIALSPARDTLATVEYGKGKKVFLWDAKTGKRKGKVELDSVMVEAHAAAFSPNKYTLALAGFSPFVMLWDLSSSTRWALFDSASICHSVAFSPNGDTIVTGGHDGQVRVWVMPKQKLGK